MTSRAFDNLKTVIIIVISILFGVLWGGISVIDKFESDAIDAGCGEYDEMGEFMWRDSEL